MGRTGHTDDEVKEAVGNLLNGAYKLTYDKHLSEEPKATLDELRYCTLFEVKMPTDGVTNKKDKEKVATLVRDYMDHITAMKYDKTVDTAHTLFEEMMVYCELLELLGHGMRPVTQKIN
jgi:hypothetical protein